MNWYNYLRKFEMLSNEARIAVLEAQMANHIKSVADIETKLDEILATMNKGKGFWAGVVFMATALGGAFGYWISYVVNLKGG